MAAIVAESRPAPVGLAALLIDVGADALHILLVLYLVAAALARRAGYINLLLATACVGYFWTPGALMLLALIVGALMLDHDSSDEVKRSRRRSSITTRRRSLQEPEWLKAAAATLLLPTAEASDDAPASDGAPAMDAAPPDDDAPDWLRQAASDLARPQRSPPRLAPAAPSRSALRSGASPSRIAASPAVGAAANSGPRVRTRGAAAKLTPTRKGADSPIKPKTPGSIRWAPDAYSPPPSRAKLHKQARSLSEGDE